MSDIRTTDNDETLMHPPAPLSVSASESPKSKPSQRWWLHIVLFVLTAASTTLAGVGFVYPATSIPDVLVHWQLGIPFSLLLLGFLSAHEFGHYFAARYHGVDATLPYYIPLPFVFFGTLGAVIRTRSTVPSRKAMFDIGVAGPLAGFVVALSYLIIGMATVPGREWLYTIHPEYRLMATMPDYGLHFGGCLLFSALREIIVPAGRWFPGMNEIYHYPLLAIGWFGMFVTALNMLPVGQLDGGHVVYSMFGRRQHQISKWAVRILLFAGFGAVAGLLLELTRTYNPDWLYQFLASVFNPPLEWIDHHAGWWYLGWPGWLFWVLLIRFIVGVRHPDTPDQRPLDRGRMIVGWIALAILVVTFSFTGVYDVPMPPSAPPPAAAPSHPTGGEEV